MVTSLLAVFFGSPFAVLATAAGAASIPVIIHLLNRKRYRVVNWAAMRFLLAAQKKNTRRLRVRVIRSIWRSVPVVENWLRNSARQPV